MNDGFLSSLILLITFIYGIKGSECKAAPLRMWVNTEMFYYFVNIIFAYFYFKYISKYRRENIRFVIVNCFLNFIHTCWLIYGNVLYYRNCSTCTAEFKNENVANQNLIWVMLILIIIGYMPMIKCCTFSVLILCFGPYLYRTIRRAHNVDADWAPTSAKLLNNMLKVKFNKNE